MTTFSVGRGEFYINVQRCCVLCLSCFCWSHFLFLAPPELWYVVMSCFYSRVGVSFRGVGGEGEVFNNTVALASNFRVK